MRLAYRLPRHRFGVLTRLGQQRLAARRGDLFGYPVAGGPQRVEPPMATTRGLESARLAALTGLAEAWIADVEAGRAWIDRRGVLNVLAATGTPRFTGTTPSSGPSTSPSPPTRSARRSPV
ncbi:hypothetical protein ABZZ20_01735 [Streptomyces sp. NPDC006430]|uniref:hypothetical protein n=1 Tax=Streptomyces sp. NPDC006430 TaxID=3154299 RepID=UPI0033A98E07